MPQQLVSIVVGQGTIEGTLVYCDAGEINGRDWYSMRFDHAGTPVKVPCSKEVYMQGKDHVGEEVRLHVKYVPDIERQVFQGDKGLKAANALTLVPRAERLEVVTSGNNPNTATDVVRRSRLAGATA